MPRGAVKEKPQSHFDERQIDDPELLEQLEIFTETRPAHRDHMAAKKAIDARIELLEPTLSDGDTLRCGTFAIPIKDRNGGGFEVPTWTKKCAGKIIDTSAPDAGDEAGDGGDD